MARKAVSEEKRALLRQAFAGGMNARQASHFAGVNEATARYYQPQRLSGEVKGSVYGLPRYDGPEWIGKSA